MPQNVAKIAPAENRCPEQKHTLLPTRAEKTVRLLSIPGMSDTTIGYGMVNAKAHFC
ncbi:hypothetical protein UYSO10_5836 [Kosakonia radicincitans]|nr:hypothetical protein UYSO10_5836 [Kosakonia radicincitans]